MNDGVSGCEAWNMLPSGRQASCLLLPFGKGASLCKAATVYLHHIYGFYKAYSKVWQK